VQKTAGGGRSDLGPGEEQLPAGQAGAGLAGDASWNTGRAHSRLTGIGPLWRVEHRLSRAGESEGPSRGSRAGSSNLGDGSAVLTPARPSGVVASVVALCAS
jgi:hypothetical protein